MARPTRGARSNAPGGWSRPTRADREAARALERPRRFDYRHRMPDHVLPHWVLRCDGGSRGNPGPGALGYALFDPTGREVEARGRALGSVTNNVAEYHALIAGLEAVSRHGVDRVVVCRDSER